MNTPLHKRTTHAAPDSCYKCNGVFTHTLCATLKTDKITLKLTENRKLYMSVFEIIGELINPGQVGEIDLNDNGKNYHKKFINIRFAISLIILGLIEYLFLNQPKHYSDFGYILRVNAIIFIYLLISFKIRVRPNSENLGWVPFLIDNPFRISDDINRFLVIINVLFMPGKCVSTSISNFYKNVIKK
ncbi:hypothetical protein [Maribellus sp. YY47]|uniref:hypothetical protein n=1 Tax=Maribellus sp. YY47 TaxID=2929486 RepID=UPI002000A883|nr:hypothetical protein [Maribellus sp. YY47]MCK3685604.1 hypothetical protein [Maribellus sp. YY47]